jgi:hypothetical protein
VSSELPQTPAEHADTRAMSHVPIPRPPPKRNADSLVRAGGDPTANLFHPLETVKQIEKWWLVIAGGANHAQQQLLLNHLTTNVAATLRKQLRGAVTTPLAYCAQRDPTNC